MRLTLAHKNGERTVLARVDDDTTVASLSTAIGTDLASVCEVSPRQAPWVPVSDTPLLSGVYIPIKGEAVRPPGALRLQIIGGPFAGHAVPLTPGRRFTVGSGHGAWLRLADPFLAEVHAHVTVGSSEHSVRSVRSAPTFNTVAPLVANVAPAPDCTVLVNGSEVATPTLIAPIDIVQIGASLFRLGVEPASDADLQPSTRGMRAFNRPSRILTSETTPTITLPGHAPEPPEPPPLPWLSAAIPIVLGVTMAAIFARPFMLLMAVASPVMVVGSFLVNRRVLRRRSENARSKWRDEVDAAEARIARLARAQRAEAWYASPDPLSITDIATKPLARLWERRVRDSDALDIRIGTARMPLNAEFQGGARSDEAPEVDVAPVPIAVDISLGPVGIAGDTAVVQALARAAITSLATLRSPRDLRIVVLCGERDEHAWGWIAWLPHTSPEEGPATSIGNTDGTRRDRLQELNLLVRLRRKAEAGADFATQIVVVIDGARDLRSLPGMIDLLRDGPAVDVYVIALETERSRLPEECRSLVLIDGKNADSTATSARVESANAFHPSVLLDGLSLAGANDIARSLCSIDHVSGAGDEDTLPASCRYVDLVGVDIEPSEAAVGASSLLQQWNLQPRRTLITVGATAVGEFALDLVADGPHALVAGTTGAGKSEFLQALVIALALANRPDALTFVLIDYKGGSAFADCERLPHTVGMVTNLDTRETERALQSLNAELKRRETVLSEMGAKDLDSAWQRDAAEASRRGLARLVLVIDEFAELKTELPEFISGLVRIARVGRSLGVHLVLATQRPSGIVTPEMQSNINLRIALRVTDRADSSDILGSAEAAHIPASFPGRGYVRTVGGGPPTAFQTARVAALRSIGVTGNRAPALVPVAELTWEGLGLAPHFPQPRIQPPDLDHDDTDLRALVDLTIGASKLGGIQPQQSPWLQPLPDVVPLKRLISSPMAEGDIALGLQDLPAQQAQRVLSWNPANDGHLLFIGGARSGRTTALRSMLAQTIVRFSPSELHLYIVDFGNGALLPLAGAPHCGAVIAQADVERLPRLMQRLLVELERRQAVLSTSGVGNAIEQRSHATPEAAIPFAIFALDGWEVITAALSPDQLMVFRDQTLRLLREGAAVGIRIVMTADRTCIGDKIASAFDTKYLLPLRDVNDYRSAGITTRGLPVSFAPGRMISGPEGIETQVALLSSEASDEAQTRRLRDCATWSHTFYAQFPQLAQLPSAFRVDPLPAQIGLWQARDLPPHGVTAALDTSRQNLVYGVGGDELARFSAPWKGITGFIATGARGSGRSTVLAALLFQLHEAGRSCVVIAPKPSVLTELARASGIAVISSTESIDLADLVAQLEALQGSQSAISDPRDSRSTTVTLFIDDAEMLVHTSIERSITSVASRVSIAMSAETDSVSALFGTALTHAKRHRQGVILAPSHSLAGSALFDTPIPKPLLGDRSIGRGVAYIDEKWVPIRVPHLAQE